MTLEEALHVWLWLASAAVLVCAGLLVLVALPPAAVVYALR